MIAYYSRRAPEYDAIWHRDDPPRQAEQKVLAEVIRRLARARSVLEVACGTGYWTQFAAETARRVVGVDASEEMLRRARARELPSRNVTWHKGDVYGMESVAGEFDAGLAAFFLSHVPRSRIDDFLQAFHGRLQPGAAVFMADNLPVDGVGGELVTMVGSEDTFKRRRLSDGSEHLVLKNYYDRDQLRRVFTPWTGSLDIHMGECFWWVSYNI